TAQYNKAFASVPELQTPVTREYMSRPSYHNYVIKYAGRDGLNNYLKDCGISTGVHYEPNNHYEMYRRYRARTPVAERVWTGLLTLPQYPELTDREVAMIVGKVKDYVARNRSAAPAAGRRVTGRPLALNPQG